MSARTLFRNARLLDPASDSRNFETVGDQAYVYFTRYNLHDCRPGQDRFVVQEAA